MTTEDDEGALRAQLEPRTDYLNKLTRTRYVIFHEDDFRALLNGMQKHYPGPYEYSITDQDTFMDEISPDIKVIMQYMRVLRQKRLVGGIEFEMPPGDFAVWPRYRRSAYHDSALETTVPIRGYHQFTDKAGVEHLRLESTQFICSYYRTDTRKKQFQGRLWRAISRVTRTDWRYLPKPDRRHAVQWNQVPKLYVGLGALRWREAGENRELKHHVVPPEGWTFPEDHPWYQFDD